MLKNYLIKLFSYISYPIQDHKRFEPWLNLNMLYLALLLSLQLLFKDIEYN